MKTDFIPKRDGDLDSFEENFINKLELHASALELDAADVTASKAIITEHRTAYSGMNSKRNDSKSATELNFLKKKNANVEIRRMAKKVKASRSYTKAIGDDLGIIGSLQITPEKKDMKPVLKAGFNGQEVVIKYRKDGTDGIRLYSRRGDEKEFQFLGIETVSRCTDNRPKIDPAIPEQREYCAIYLVNYLEVGHRSDVMKVVVP